MSNFEYVGEHPITLAGVVLGDGVSIERGPAWPVDVEEVQEDGQSPILMPHDHLILPDDHHVVHGALIDADGHHAGEVIPEPADEVIRNTRRAKAADDTDPGAPGQPEE